MKFRRFGVSLIATALLLLGIVTPTSAQTISTPGFSAAISPLPILLNAKPGSSVSTDLRVNNPSTHAEKLKVVVKTFTQDGPNGNVALHDPTPADTYVNWIHFSKTSFDAPPGLWQTIKMTVDVPPTASFGYYFAVEFTSATPPAQNSTGAAVQGAVASFVLLNAQTAGEKRQLQITSFSADHRSYEFLPASFTIRLHNSGNVFAGASGNIFIMRGSKQVGVLDVNENHGLVLPSSNRVFTVSWSDGFPVYKKTADGKRQLSWNFSQMSHLRFGHYTAKLVLVYNDGQTDVPINGSLSFWVVPWRLIGIVLFILMLIAGLTAYVVVLRRRLKRINKSRDVSRGTHEK